MYQFNRWISRAFTAIFFLLLSISTVHAAVPSPEITKGLTWLQSQVQTSGTLANESLSIATPLQNRTEVLQTLKLLATPPTALADLLAADTESDTEYLARRIVTLSLAGRDVTALITQLQARQNPDGGFGGSAGFASNALDTAWVLLAYKAGGVTAGIPAALAYLGTAQAADGSYRSSSADADLYESAMAVIAMSAYAGQYNLGATIQKTVSHAQAIQSASSGWSNSNSLTALAYIAIHDFVPSAPTASVIKQFLTVNQATNGSWESDPYVTALVLRALTLADQTPANPLLAIIRGNVVDGQSGLPLNGVSAMLTGPMGLTSSNTAAGLFEFRDIAPGSYSLQLIFPNYGTISTSTVVQAGQVLDLGTLVLNKTQTATTGTVRGVVKDAVTNLPLAGASINISGVVTPAITDATGSYQISNVPAGQINVTASQIGYTSVSGGGMVSGGSVLIFSPNLYAANVTPPGGNKTNVTGGVLDAGSGTPLAGAGISITSNGVTTNVVAAADGRFNFTNIDVSVAVMQVNAAGYQGATIQLALQPLGVLDVGQVRLRKTSVNQLLPDLSVSTLNRSGALTDPQSLTLSGVLAVDVANGGTLSSPSNVQVLAFHDANRNGIYDPNTDLVLGQSQLNALSPGQNAALQLSVAGQLPFRDAPIHVWIDSAQAVSELNETNNFASTADSAQIKPSIGTFKPVLKWAWTGSTVLSQYDQVMSIPIVAPLEDTNGDGRIDQKDIPAVIFQSYAGINYTADGVLRAVSGKDGHELWTVTNPNYRTNGSGSLAVADIDGDGVVEVIAPKSGGGIIVFEHTGAFKWQSAMVSAGYYGGASVSDLDGDGVPEIVVGNSVLSANGTLRWKGNGFTGNNYPSLLIGNLSVVADINLDGTPEVIAGAAAYSSTGALLWQNNAVGDGYVAVGNFDSDPYPEIVVVSSGRVFLLNHDGTMKWGPVYLPGGGNGGAPTVADMDGDGIPEIGVAGASRYVVLKADGSILWTAVTQDQSSSMTGSSVFDFDGDGAAEVVYGDEQNLHVYNGRTGNEVFSKPNSSGTTCELPVIADVDNDNHADIVIVSNQLLPRAWYWYSGPSMTGIRVYQDANNSWVNTRKIWNQHSYHITNINDDGSVPRIEQNSWQGANNYRLNAMPGRSATAVADLTASYLRVEDWGGTQPSVLTARVGNAGALEARAGIFVAFYNGQPGAGGTLLGTAQTSAVLGAGTFEDVRLNVATLNGIREVVVVADDNGAGVHAIDDFSRLNNVHSLPLVAQMTSLSLAATTDAPVYGANSVVRVSATVQNHGSFDVSSTLRFSIENADGLATVAVLPAGAPVAVGRNSSQVAVNLWNTATTYAGAYRAKVELIGANGAPFAAAYAPFSIVAGTTQSASARIVSDKKAYQAFDTVTITNRITNLAKNQVLDNLIATTTLYTPVGTVLWSSSGLPLGQIGAANSLNFSYAVPLVNASFGRYRAVLIVQDMTGKTVASSETFFDVLSSAVTGSGLKGQITALPKIVPQTDPVLLDGSINNLGNADISALPVTVRIVNPATQQVMSQWTYSANVLRGQPFQTSLTWDTSPATIGTTYVAVMTALVSGKEITLAQDNFMVTDPPVKLDVTQSSVRENRVLVWLACDAEELKGEEGRKGADSRKASVSKASAGKSDSHAGDDDKKPKPLVPQCIQARTAFLQGLLTSYNVPYLITSNRDDFRKAFRDGRYNVYWISGAVNAEAAKEKTGKEKTGKEKAGKEADKEEDDDILKEVREAVFRGDSLILDGDQSEHSEALQEAAGVEYRGKLPARNNAVTTSGLLFSAARIQIVGTANKLRTATGTVQAAFDLPVAAGEHDGRDGHDGHEEEHDPKKPPKPQPAIVGNAYGRGQTLAFGFDLVNNLQNGSGMAAWNGILLTGLTNLLPPLPDKYSAGAYVGLATQIKELAKRTTDLAVTAHLPSGATLLNTVPSATLDASGNPVWKFTLPATASKQLLLTLRLPMLTGTYVLPVTVDSIRNGKSKRYGEYSYSWTVAGSDRLLSQVANDLQLLVLNDPEEQEARGKAVRRLQQAASHIAQKRYAEALEALLDAVDKLHEIRSVDVSAYRLSLDRLLQETGWQWLRAAGL